MGGLWGPTAWPNIAVVKVKIAEYAVAIQASAHCSANASVLIWDTSAILVLHVSQA